MQTRTSCSGVCSGERTRSLEGGLVVVASSEWDSSQRTLGGAGSAQVALLPSGGQAQLEGGNRKVQDAPRGFVKAFSPVQEVHAIQDVDDPTCGLPTSNINGNPGERRLLRRCSLPRSLKMFGFTKSTGSGCMEEEPD